MSFLREWILSILACALVLSLLRALMPKGSVRKVGELAIGMVLFLVIVRPLTELTPAWLTHIFADQVTAASAYPDDLTVTNESYLESVMSQRCEEYIISQAQKLGVEIAAEVECVWQGGYPVPDKVVLVGTASKELERMIQSELGVAADRIVYEEVKG